MKTLSPLLTSAFLTLCLAHSAVAAPQAFEIQGIKFTVEAEHSGGMSIQVPTAAGIQLQAFILQNPARLVADISGIRRKLRPESKNISLSPLSSVRLGVHPDKARLVFDFNTDSITMAEERSGLAVNLKVEFANQTEQSETPAAQATEAPTLTRPTQTPTARPSIVATEAPSPLPTNTPSPSPKATLAPTQTPVPTKQATIEPSPTASATPTQVPSTATPRATFTPSIVSKAATDSSPISGISVSALQFDYADADRAPILRITLSSKVEFKLSKKDDKTFKVLINNCRLSSRHLALPIFPPQEFVGLTFSMAQQIGDDVEITIGVERGIKVSALPRDNQIWVKSLNR